MSKICRNFTMYQINNEYEYQDQGYRPTDWQIGN